jgi:hypothetical protein
MMMATKQVENIKSKCEESLLPKKRKEIKEENNSSK